MEATQFPLTQKEILDFLPHRYPFLFVDRVLEISGPNPMDDENPKNKIGIKVIGIKNVTAVEPHFTGHFPDAPILPGVIMIETMAQVASFSMYPLVSKQKREQGASFQCVMVGVDQARFRALVTPGDSLRVETEVTACRSSIWTFTCKAYVEGKLVAEANLMANMVNAAKKQVY
jgi:3-hydroxyacyl-[acyl-carrier-protein] dehydratase